MSASETVGAVGIVRVGDLEITVTPLSQAEEMALDRTLNRGAEVAAGDYYTRCKGILDATKDNPADRLEILREIARISIRREPLSVAEVYAFRESPEGVAVELFHRGRKATPGLTLQGLRTVITEVNCDEVGVGLMELLTGGDGEKKARTR